MRKIVSKWYLACFNNLLPNFYMEPKIGCEIGMVVEEDEGYKK